MSVSRQCSKTACPRPAVATLTYIYVDSTCVIGPLAVYAEPHSYDLCAEHATRLTPPVGWELLRLPLDLARMHTTDVGEDDLLAVVDAVRERPTRSGLRPIEPVRTPVAAEEHSVETARKRHLRILRDEDR